jgi:hypothetical protein
LKLARALLYAAMAARTLLENITLISTIGKDFQFKEGLEVLQFDHIRTVNMPSTRFNIKYNMRWEAEYLKANYGAGSKISASTIPTHLRARVAALRFSGRWSESNFNQKSKELTDELAKSAVKTKGNVFVMRYSAPFTPWFLRRNEVAIEVELD